MHERVNEIFCFNIDVEKIFYFQINLFLDSTGNESFQHFSHRIDLPDEGLKNRFYSKIDKIFYSYILIFFFYSKII